MPSLRMMPYECNPITGICEGGFGGGGNPTGIISGRSGGGGYSWIVRNVPYFAGYTGQPETPILIYEPGPKTPETPVSTPGPGFFGEPSTPLVATVTPTGVVVSHGQTQQIAQAEVAGVPLLWIGAGLLALFLLNK